MLTTAGIDTVDILQIDTEGADRIVFDQFWDKGIRPAIVMIEVVHLSDEDTNHIKDTMSSSGYTVEIDLDNPDDIVGIRQ